MKRGGGDGDGGGGGSGGWLCVCLYILVMCVRNLHSFSANFQVSSNIESNFQHSLKSLFWWEYFPNPGHHIGFMKQQIT